MGEYMDAVASEALGELLLLEASLPADYESLLHRLILLF
jgi:hypothetical protein